MPISEQERERRREMARRLHAEGRLGGSEFGKLGGRPRKVRASELVAERAKDEAKLIAQTFLDALQSEKVPMHVKVAAAEKWLAIEHREDELKLKEDKALEGLHKDALVSRVGEMLSRLVESGAI